MFFLYSILLTVYFIGSLPILLWRRENYISGFRQKLGYLPDFRNDGRSVLWLHCFSAGEVEAARPIVKKLFEKFPNCRLVISTTTKAGRDLAREMFTGEAELIFYFPFDWKFCVKRVVNKIKPNIIFMMEDDLWFNFIREAGKNGARIFVLNGRLSEKAFKRYHYFRETLRRVWRYVDEVLVQSEEDAKRFLQLGVRSYKIKITGNIKFDPNTNQSEAIWTNYFRERFAISKSAPLIVAAGTHSPEENWILEAFKEVWKHTNDKLPRLLLAPENPERYDEVLQLIRKTGFDWVKLSEPLSDRDETAEIILLDNAGDIHSIFSLAEIVFIGGNLISSGGNGILEAALAEKTIVTEFNAENCKEIIKEFLAKNAIIQLPDLSEKELSTKLTEVLLDLLQNAEKRETLAANACAVMQKNRGAIEKTIEHLQPYLYVQSGQFIR